MRFGEVWRGLDEKTFDFSEQRERKITMHDKTAAKLAYVASLRQLQSIVISTDEKNEIEPHEASTVLATDFA